MYLIGVIRKEEFVSNLVRVLIINNSHANTITGM